GGHLDGVGISLAAGAGVGVAAVREDGPALAAAYPLAVYQDRRGHHLVESENTRDRRFPLGDDQREVRDVSLLDAGGHAGGQDPGHGGDPPWEERLHRFPS